jgi:hypothetical protein
VLVEPIRMENVEGERANTDLPRVLHPLLRFPAIRMCSTMWISILVRQVGKHGI